ncbi:DUF3822 family protein [Formosa sp. Hel1_31_208]|uniref:DUF3822 family protein n=1 Tax=Formosa sp. Hel1_31_208 TaxID=1798225 RepID=UPI001E474998|nr:DUF3822 family protein [Formosa sp. Hel1_31_208]
MKQNSIKALSIQIQLSGLSFCILNRSKHTIEFLKHIRLEKKATPYELLNKLTAFITSQSELNETFDSVTCIYQNELSCLVPNALFNENNLADYLKFNAKILKTDYISYDTLVLNDSANVYVPLVNINNYLFETYGSFEYKHASTILIETLLQSVNESTQERMHINVNTSSFEIICVKNGQLICYNTFEYSTKEDFIYYILFTIEQLKLNPETIVTELSGLIEEDYELYQIVYKYIRNVAILEPTYNYGFVDSIKKHNAHNNFILLNSFN